MIENKVNDFRLKQSKDGKYMDGSHKLSIT